VHVELVGDQGGERLQRRRIIGDHSELGQR
jgi:hypothetical protein